MSDYAMSDLYRMDPRKITRAQYLAVRRNARRGRCSYRVGLCYIGRDVVACDSSGCYLPRDRRARALNLAHAAACRREKRYDAARQILALWR